MGFDTAALDVRAGTPFRLPLATWRRVRKCRSALEGCTEGFTGSPGNELKRELWTQGRTSLPSPLMPI